MKKALRGLSMLLCTVLLCVAANFLAFTIDSQDMRDHAWQGCLMLGEQQSTPQTIGGFMSARPRGTPSAITNSASSRPPAAV